VEFRSNLVKSCIIKKNILRRNWYGLLSFQHHLERMLAFFPYCVGQGGAVGNACIPDCATFVLHKNVRSTFGDA